MIIEYLNSESIIQFTFSLDKNNYYFEIPRNKFEIIDQSSDERNMGTEIIHVCSCEDIEEFLINENKENIDLSKYRAIFEVSEYPIGALNFETNFRIELKL